MAEVRGMSSSRVWDYENAFYWFSSPSRLDKALAHYELYKRIVDLPGHVMEFGVYKAASLIRLASFRRLLETETSRKIVGFDAFGTFPHAEGESDADAAFISSFESEAGDGLTLEQVEAILAHKGFKNVELVGGNIGETLPAWLDSHPETQIALLHVDTDVYSPSKTAIEHCWDRLVPGGLLVLDDYNAVEGETRAVNELLRRESLRVHKLPFYNVPAFVMKP